jgi:hypothetical protein
MGGSTRNAALALAAGFAAAFPMSVVTAARAGGSTDYSGSFGGDVDSGGTVTKFTTVRCDSDGYSAGITVDSFTSPSSRQMNFRPVQTAAWDYQSGTSWLGIAQGDTAVMDLTQHCWRFGVYVSPGRDTNGSLSPGDGTTTFDGQLKY